MQCVGRAFGRCALNRTSGGTDLTGAEFAVLCMGIAATTPAMILAVGPDTGFELFVLVLFGMSGGMLALLRWLYNRAQMRAHRGQLPTARLLK